MKTTFTSRIKAYAYFQAKNVDPTKVREMIESGEIQIGEPQKETNGWKKDRFIEYLQETLIPDLKESGSEATAEDFETALQFIQKEEDDDDEKFQRQEYIDNISGLYPPDSEYEKTAEIGEKLLMRIAAEQWRDLPLYILAQFSSSCTEKDNSNY